MTHVIIEHTPDMNNRVRAALIHHKLAKFGDCVLEADLIYAVLESIKQSNVLPDSVKIKT